MKHKYFECGCEQLDCLIRMSYIEDEEDILYVSHHLPRAGFFKRLWRGIKYILGYRSLFGEFGEVVWEKATVEQYTKFAEEFLKG